jgi:hypothetical protein
MSDALLHELYDEFSDPNLFSRLAQESDPAVTPVTAGDARSTTETEMQLNDREVAAVLAGLRLIERDVIGPRLNRLPPGISAILEYAGEPLSPTEIDDLCERINNSGPTRRR